jgi:predicted house-cleaning NTP pyrophosphatase (Maf/HAM1 superfamily)
VYSGVVVKYKDEIRKFTEVTTVYMARLTPEEVLAYVETGEPM